MPRTSTRERRTYVPPFGAPHVFVLAAIEGENPDSVHRVRAAESTIGRGDDAEIRLLDPEVSARHCLLRVSGPVCSLVDLESLNGTFLNGQPMRPGVTRRLRHLDEIRVGGTRLLFLTGRVRHLR